jgi:glycosyltransferase involved in cell wall biosynthesis
MVSIPRVAVLFDNYDWSFHRIAQQVERHLSGEFDVRIMPQHELDRDWLISCDAVICVWYGVIKALLQGTHDHASWQAPILSPQCKIIVCLYEEILQWRADLDREMLHFALAHADMVLCSSEGMARRLWPGLPTPKAVGYCRDGIDESLFPFHPFRDDLFDAATPLRVGWVGNTEPGLFAQTKGVSTLRQICNATDGVKFYLHDRAKHGTIPHDQIHEELALCDLIACYSAAEGTPNPILEASAIGRPWVSPDVGIVSELLRDAQEMGFASPPGLVIPRDRWFLAAALERLRDDREQLVAMAGCGWQVVHERWTWAQQVQQFRAALYQVGVGVLP